MLLSEYLKILLDYSKLLSDYPESPRLFLKSTTKIRQIKLAFSVYVRFRPFPSVSVGFLPFSSIFIRFRPFSSDKSRNSLSVKRFA